jgi:hypothetical protein
MIPVDLPRLQVLFFRDYRYACSAIAGDGVPSPLVAAGAVGLLDAAGTGLNRFVLRRCGHAVLGLLPAARGWCVFSETPVTDSIKRFRPRYGLLPCDGR